MKKCVNQGTGQCCGLVAQSVMSATDILGHRQGFGAGVFGWSRHFGPAPAPP